MVWKLAIIINNMAKRFLKLFFEVTSNILEQLQQFLLFSVLWQTYFDHLWKTDICLGFASSLGQRSCKTLPPWCLLPLANYVKHYIITNAISLDGLYPSPTFAKALSSTITAGLRSNFRFTCCCQQIYTLAFTLVKKNAFILILLILSPQHLNLL